MLKEAGWTLTWTRLSVNHVAHILYLLHWHPGPLLKVCSDSTKFPLCFFWSWAIWFSLPRFVQGCHINCRHSLDPVNFANKGTITCSCHMFLLLHDLLHIASPLLIFCSHSNFHMTINVQMELSSIFAYPVCCKLKLSNMFVVYGSICFLWSGIPSRYLLLLCCVL